MCKNTGRFRGDKLNMDSCGDTALHIRSEKNAKNARTAEMQYKSAKNSEENHSNNAKENRIWQKLTRT